MKLITKLWKEKCPSCGDGDVYESKGNVLLFKVPKMREQCEVCNYRFEKEPGYFTGAMYVSYALCIAEMLVAVLLGLVFDYSLEPMVYPLVLVIVLFWTFNFRMSRLIWMYFV